MAVRRTGLYAEYIKTYLFKDYVWRSVGEVTETAMLHKNVCLLMANRV